MAGHSKWKNIQHRKSAQDAKRGQIFTKLIKEITVASRLGGGEIEANPRLRTAVANAKSQGVPKENITRAIQKGTGEQANVSYEEILYEGFGPHNIAFIVEVMTDNRNRSIANIRYIFNKFHGTLGSANSVQYLFDYIGSILIDRSSLDEERLTELAVESGADDVLIQDEEIYQVLTQLSDYQTVHTFLEKEEVSMLSTGLIWKAKNSVELHDSGQLKSVIKFIELLEEDDDVQAVYSNLKYS